MDKRFKYEIPLLVDLREDMSCSGMSCSNGSGGMTSCACGHRLRLAPMQPRQLRYEHHLRNRDEGRVVLQRQLRLQRV